MIIRGGENIYPREIDEVLYQHPDIAAAAAVGVPDELYGEEVAAVVVLKPGAKSSEQEVIDYCKARLADLQVSKDSSLRRGYSERSDREVVETRTGEDVVKQRA